MKKNYTLALLLATIALFAQSENDKKVFLDSLNRETKEGNHLFYRIIKDYYTEKEKCYFYEYSNTGKLYKVGQLLKKEYFSPINEVKNYYENGNLKDISIYNEKSIKSGKYNSWYPNGKNKVEGEYIFIKTKKEEDELVLKIHNFWNEDGVKKVINGNGIYEHYDESELNIINTERGEVKNGLKTGTWEGKEFYKTKTSSELRYTEKYENGGLIEGKSIDEKDNEYTYKRTFIQAEPKKGMLDFMKYVQKNYKTPELNKSIDGKVLIEFVVEKNGELTNFVILNDLGFGTAEEAIRMLKTYPDLWLPGLNRGKPVRVRYSLPIRLKIDVR